MNVQEQIDLLYKRIAAIEAEVDVLKRGGFPLPPSGTRSIMDLKDIKEAKQSLAARLKLKHTVEVATGTRWQDEDARNKYLELRAEIYGLEEQIANMK